MTVEINHRGELMSSSFRWMQRHNNYCVSAVESAKATEVLSRFGGDVTQSVHGGNRDAADLHSANPRHLPTLCVLEFDGWCLAVELFSSEGLREPVLRHIAEDSRVLCVGMNYNAERRLAYADRAGPIGPFSAPLRTMPEWDLLERVAASFGLSLDEWSDENVPASSIEFLGRVCGRPVDDEVMTRSGLVSVMLPLLPATFSVDVPVRSQLDVRVAALTESSSDEQLRPAVARQVQEMLRDALVDSDAVRAAVDAFGDHAAEVTDESAAGRDLRTLLAEQYLLAGSAPAHHTSKSSQGIQSNLEQVQRRVSAGTVAAALLRGGPQAALAEMLHRRAGTAWRDDLIEDLAVVVPTPAAVAKASALLEVHLTRRAASRPVPQAWLSDRDDTG